MDIFGIPILSIAVWLAVGGVCGWLETLRVKERVLPDAAYWLTGAAGACLAGLFFLRWGELVPGSPLLAPLVSGIVGASIAITALSLASKLRRST